MKGVPGIMIAVGLGVVGAFCNWFYLNEKARDLDLVTFIAVNSNVRINAGDKFDESHFMPVPIPQEAVGNLDKVAYLWSVRGTLEGMRATKSYVPGEIILQQDMRTLPPTSVQELLGEDEVEIGIPVDTRSFVPSLVNPGDLVSFIVPTGAVAPVPVPAGDGTIPPPAASPAGTEIIGPYRVVSMGNRLASPEVMRAGGVSASQENIMGVAVKFSDGKFEEKGRRLSEVLRMSNFQQAQVILHPASKAAKAKK
jgi:hypothetical protein